MFLAGGVGVTALSMLYRDLDNAHDAAAFAEQFGPFKPWFFYGVAAVEIVMILAFIYAVIQSIIHRKELENHAWWLIATVFIIMMPALGRGIQNTWILFYGFGMEINVMTPIYITNFLIIAFILWAALRFGRIKHPATYLAIGVNIFNCFLEPIGKSKSIQSYLEWMIQP
jgi:hypothetical protein